MKTTTLGPGLSYSDDGSGTVTIMQRYDSGEISLLTLRGPEIENLKRAVGNTRPSLVPLLIGVVIGAAVTWMLLP